MTAIDARHSFGKERACHGMGPDQLFYSVLIPFFSYLFELLKFILCVLGIIALYKYIKQH